MKKSFLPKIRTSLVRGEEEEEVGNLNSLQTTNFSFENNYFSMHKELYTFFSLLFNEFLFLFFLNIQTRRPK